MHGFFVDQKLYHRVKSVAKPFEYEEWRKAKVSGGWCFAMGALSRNT